MKSKSISYLFICAYFYDDRKMCLLVMYITHTNQQWWRIFSVYHQTFEINKKIGEKTHTLTIHWYAALVVILHDWKWLWRKYFGIFSRKFSALREKSANMQIDWIRFWANGAKDSLSVCVLCVPQGMFPRWHSGVYVTSRRLNISLLLLESIFCKQIKYMSSTFMLRTKTKAQLFYWEIYGTNSTSSNCNLCKQCTSHFQLLLCAIFDKSILRK